MGNIHIAACLPVVLALATPVAAQSLAELDRLSDMTAQEDTGVAAAQEQAERGAYLEALSTLERVMAVYPRSVAARLLHAIYLCRIDDRQGGLVEIDQMDEDLFGAANIADARNRCSRPYVEPRAVAPPPPPPAPTAPAAIETVQLPPSTAAEGKEQPLLPAIAPPPPATPASGSNAISGRNAISDTTAPRSSSSSSSQQPESTSGGEKD